MSQTLDKFAKIIAPSVLLTAILTYMSYIRNRSFYDYFEIKQSLLSFTSENSIIRFSETILEKFPNIVLPLVFLLFGHFWIVNSRKKKVLIGVTISLFILGIPVLLLSYLWEPIWVSAVFYPASALGFVLVGYGFHLIWRLSHLLGERWEWFDWFLQAPVATHYLIISPFLILITWGIFQTININWHNVGTDQAKRALEISPCVKVYSQSDLGFPYTYQNDEGTYMYSKLRFLTYANNKYFFISNGWPDDNGAFVAVVPDDKGFNIVVEISKTITSTNTTCP